MRIIFLLVIAFNFSSTIACSCVEPKPLTKDDFDKAGEIFIGKVIKITENINDRSERSKSITFQVVERLKPSFTSNEITIRTGYDNTVCGLFMNVGEQWYIFANRNEANELQASSCGRSVHMDKKTFTTLGNDKTLLNTIRKEWQKKMNRYKQDRKFITRLIKNDK